MSSCPPATATSPVSRSTCIRYVKGLGLIPRVMGNIKGSAGPVSQPDDAEGVRGEVGAEPDDGHEFRRRFEGVVRADDRRERDRYEGAEARDVRSAITMATWTSSRRCTTSTCSESSVGSWTTSSGPSPTRASICLAEHPDPKHRHYLNLYKLGEGPLLQLLHAMAPVPLRGPEHGRPRRPVRRCGGSPARRTHGGGVRVRQEVISRRARCSTITACT